MLFSRKGVKTPMRDSSYNFHTQTQQIFSRGGEKKVMKKSLSILLSFALVFGLFASMASAADTELTVAQKYQALVDKGVLKGNPDGDARLDANLNRAEFATIAIAISGLAPEKPATATFSDVNSKQWWYGAIEAAAKAGLVEGYNGKFDPKANVTVEQVIKVAVQAADLKIDEKAEAVEGASAWAAPYIKAALDAGLIATGLDYKADATRGQTILVGYSVYEKLNPTEPAKVSVVSAKVTGAAKVTVELDKAVDTEKAKLTLKRGSSTVATETKWADDKKSAVLTLTSTKISEADYSVTLEGLAAEDVATNSASFKGENEKVTKLDFVTAGDEIATTVAARIRLKAENQYGEIATFNAASFTANVSADFSPTLTKDSDGYLVVKLNTKAAVTANKATSGLTQIPVYVYSNEHHVTASKTFKLMFEPFVSKLELGEFKYDNGKTSLVNKGDTATAKVKLYDQYGNPVVYSQGLDLTFHNNIVPYSQSIDEIKVDDFDNDDEYEVRVALKDKEDKAQSHTLTLYNGSGNAQAKFEIGTSKVATKLDFESFDGVIAEGDAAGKLITLNVYDANGDKLTNQEIADNASRIKVDGSGAGTPELVTVGPDKGKIRLGAVTVGARGYVFVTASILSMNTNTYKQLQIPVVEKRIPASLSIEKKPHVKAVIGSPSAYKIVAKDQHGAVIKTNDVKYRVVYEPITNTAGISYVTPTLNSDNATSDLATLDAEFAVNTTAGQFGSGALKVHLEENKSVTATPDWRAVSSPVTVSIESIDPSKVELNYTVADITSLYASLDNLSLFPAPATEASVLGSKTSKGLELTVKDNAGNSVAFNRALTNVASSNGNVVRVDTASDKVTGYKAGEATVTGVVYKATGDTTLLTAKVTVKNDAVAVDSIKFDTASTKVATPAGSVGTLAKLIVKDNYGIEYKEENGDVSDYDRLLGGIRYTVSEFSGAKVTINPLTGALSGFALDSGNTSGKYHFVVTATAANGKSASTVFYFE